VRVDSFHQLETPRFEDKQVFQVAKMIDPTLGSKDAQVLHMMHLRSIANNGVRGPYIVTTDDFDLAIEDLDLILSIKFKNGELEDFLNE
jgi:hypothetical protein